MMNRVLWLVLWIATVVTILTWAWVLGARAETMTVERVVPKGATLSYSEYGSIVRTINVPEGRVRVTIEYGGPVRPRHGRKE